MIEICEKVVGQLKDNPDMEIAEIRSMMKEQSMKYIMKEDINYATKEYIRIDLGREMINLPKFDSGSMYKGMKLNRGYTLEELGL